MIVLNGNDQEFVATSSGCSTNGEYCKEYYGILQMWLISIVEFFLNQLYLCEMRKLFSL